MIEPQLVTQPQFPSAKPHARLYASFYVSQAFSTNAVSLTTKNAKNILKVRSADWGSSVRSPKSLFYLIIFLSLYIKATLPVYTFFSVPLCAAGNADSPSVPSSCAHKLKPCRLSPSNLFHVLQATSSTAVRQPTSARSPRGDASRARPAASWSVWLWACWGRVREKVSSLSFSVDFVARSFLKAVWNCACFSRPVQADPDHNL